MAQLLRVSNRKPKLEVLEAREVPAVFGQTWPNFQITVSFAPDGTLTPSGPSQLHQSLSATMAQSVWQQSILDAFQAWADVSPVSFQLVSDTGLPAGTPGAPQGDSRFGDIRIYGVSLGPEVLSVAVPYDSFLSGTLAGDIFVNTDVAFTPDLLLTAMLQESGHALGLSNSYDPSSVMWEWEHGAVALAPSDIFAIQTLYANPTGVGFEQTADTLMAAGSATYFLQAPTSSTTTLTYSVVLPEGGSMPNVVVRDAANQVVPSELLVTNEGQLTLRIENVAPGSVYLVELTSTDSSNPTPYLFLRQFSQQPAAVEKFLAGVIEPQNGLHSVDLELDMPMYFQFTLKAMNAPVTLTIRDLSGAVVTSMTVAAGQTWTAPTLFLREGEYAFEFSATGTTEFRLWGLDLSDPIGVRKPGNPAAPSAPGSPGPTPPSQSPPLSPGDPPPPPSPPPPTPTPIPGSWWRFRKEGKSWILPLW
jgi:hypothetical protein